MANIFKNAHAKAVDTSYTTVYAAPSAKTSIILAVSLCNVTTGTITVSLIMRDTGVDGGSDANHRVMLNNVEIPSGSTLEVLAGQKYVLETSDDIQVKSSVNNSLDVVMGVMEIDN